jgi:3-hydroxyisobutyrate dehydrogenase-like beta-hydroxyacid dehydrogenase
MRIGFVGLGKMGEGMAGNLLAAGHDLIVYNRTRQKAEPLARRGARIAARPADLADAEAVVTMLADDAALEEVAFGKDGLVAALPAGRTHISMSTISVALSERLAQAHQAAQQTYVAAPVFGRPEAAAAAKLFIVAAGAPEAIALCQPIFASLGQRTFALPGPPAAANLVKLSGNFLIAAVIEGLAEAIALIRKAGIDPRTYLDILTNTLFTAPVYKTYGELIVGEKYDQVGFGAALGLKDIRLALAAAEASRAPLPLASLLRDHLLTVLAQGGDAQDWSALGRLAARNAGL